LLLEKDRNKYGRKKITQQKTEETAAAATGRSHLVGE
jgi:hypothetical protein